VIRVFKHKYQWVSTLIFFIVFSYFIGVILEYPKMGIEVKHDSKQFVISNILENSWAGEQDF
jgi:two-component system sensor histidine kinase ComP